MESPHNIEEYYEGHIRDTLWLIAMALDKVMKECLGNPRDTSVVIDTIEKNAWRSRLALSKALGSTPVEIRFDERAHRMLPMALGNLVNGTWQVAGVYDPTAKKFIERPEIQWPKTGKSAPRSWFSCKPGERLVSDAAAGQLQQCERCNKGTFSAGGQSTVCVECAPGERNRTIKQVPSLLELGRRDDCAKIDSQATFSLNHGSSAASAATLWGISFKIGKAKRPAKLVRRAHSDTSELSAQLTAARVSARKVRFRSKQPLHGGVHSLIDSGTPPAMLQASITRGNRPGR